MAQWTWNSIQHLRKTTIVLHTPSGNQVWESPDNVLRMKYRL